MTWRASKDERRTSRRSDPAADQHLRILVEQMVRDGRSEREINAAVRTASAR